MRNFSAKKILLALLVVAGSSHLSAFDADARLQGDAELGYTSYDLDSDGKNFSKNSFYHRYSFLYSNSGSIQKGKLGRYRYAVGYDWASVDATVKNPSTDYSSKIRSGHLLFAGELQLQSREYPVSLVAWSNDLSRSQFQYDALSLYDGARASDIPIFSDMLEPRVVDTLNNGTNIDSGAKLSIGVKDNLVPSKKALFFGELPLIVFDYRDRYVSDLKSLTPQHSHSQEFTASLTKFQNSFVYRYYRFQDIYNKLSPWDSSEERHEFLLGTVDSRKNRLWVDLTNWIKISADAQFTKEIDAGRVGTTESYDVNIFAIAQRERWTARTFNSFFRERRGDSFHDRTVIPFYLEGKWDIDTTWQTRFSVTDENWNLANFDGSSSKTSSKTYLSTFRAEAFKRSPFTLTPSLSIESTSGDTESKLVVYGRVETASTRRFSDRMGIFGSYDIRYEGSDNGESLNQVNQDIIGRLNTRLGDRSRLTLDQQVTISSGKNNNGPNPGLYNPYGVTATDLSGDYIRSISTATVSWDPVARLRLSAQASANITDSKDAGVENLMRFSSSIDYSMPNYTMNGNISVARKFIGELVSGRQSTEIASSGRVAFTPTRDTEASIQMTYSRFEDVDSTVTETLDLRQRIKYSFVRSAFTGRKLFEVTEEAGIINNPVGINSWTANISQSGNYKIRRHITLIGNYYPFRNLTIGGSTRYSILEPGDGSSSTQEWLGSAYITLAYNKLQTTLDYTYGRRSGNDSRLEKRFSANLKKQF